MNPHAVTSWSSVSTALAPPAPAQSGAPPPQQQRSDQQVLQQMRDSIKYVNDRPYMFVDSADGVRPIPVTEDRSEVFERIFRELKERPGSSRLDDQFGDLYSPEHLMRQ